MCAMCIDFGVMLFHHAKTMLRIEKRQLDFAACFGAGLVASVSCESLSKAINPSNSEEKQLVQPVA